MTEKPVKPLSERIGERIDYAKSSADGIAHRSDVYMVALAYRLQAETLAFLAELAREQAKIKAMLADREKK